MKKIVLITGASGFIGKHLIRSLINNNYFVVCLDLNYDDNFFNEFQGKLKIQKGNLMNGILVKNLIKKYSPNYVFHLAGSKSRTNSLVEFKTSHEINYLGTFNLFEALLEDKNLKLVAILGTIEEYGHACSPFREDSQELPNSAYGLSKLSATKLASIFNLQFNLPVIVLRPSIAFGPEQGEEMFIPAIIKTLLRKQPFKMTEGNQFRDFLFIDDLIEALVKCLECSGVEGQIVNIASGMSITIKDIAIQIANITKSKENLKIGELPYRYFEIMDYSIDISKAADLLQWNPKTKLCDGLGKTISFYKNNILNEE